MKMTVQRELRLRFQCIIAHCSTSLVSSIIQYKYNILPPSLLPPCSPYKYPPFLLPLSVQTLPLYLCLVGVWLVTVLIPGRWIILLIGLWEFLGQFVPAAEGDAFSVRMVNLLTGEISN